MDVDQTYCKNDCHFRLLFPQESVGRVIGKSGENLKNCRSQLSPGASVRVPEVPSYSQCKDRILAVSCLFNEVPTLLTFMAPSIFSGMELIQKEFCLLVPVDKAGLLLGTKGSTIENIRYSSGCQVKMFKDKLPYSDERIFYIPGREDILEKMIAAVTEALEILMQDKLTHEYIHYCPFAVSPEDFVDKDCGGYNKAYIEKYGIQSSEDMYAQYSASYGDYSNYSNSGNLGNTTNSSYGNSASTYGASGGTNTSTSTSAPASGTVNGNQANTANNGSSYGTESYDQYQQWNSGNTNYQQTGYTGYDANSYGYGDTSGSAMQTGHDDFMNEEITKELVIDDEYTSYIIGPKGSRIKSIRDKTSAVIRIGEDSSVTDRKRQIVIKGKVKEVMWAYKSVQALLREAIETKQPLPIPGIPGDVVEQSVLFRYLADKHPYIPCDNMSSEQETKVIEIDNSKTGAIIGVKAVIISEIRKVSNCKVTVEKDSECVGDRRKITLMGTPKEIHLADYFINAVQLYPNLTRQIKDVMMCGY